MILQRMSQAIKRQDWFQVTIEIFVVVIGIFLGLQVTEWNDDRIERQEERGLLAALSEDIEVNISTIETQVRFANEKINTINELFIRSVGQKSTDVPLDALLSDLMWYSPISFQSGAVDAYLFNGNSDILTNEEIRKLVIEMPRTLDLIKSTAEQERNFTTSDMIKYFRENTNFAQIAKSNRGQPGNRDYKQDRTIPLSDKLIRDHSILFEDTEFLGLMVQALAYSNDIRIYLPLIKQNLKSALALVKAELE